MPRHPPTTTGDDAAPASEDVEIDGPALQVLLDDWRTEVDSYGATPSIRVPGHDDIHLASGVDGRDPETPMPTDGTYWIGTATRTFVAAAALQLVDEGRLSLDEPVEPWLPEFPDADQITLAMLLDFTSGLPQQDDAADAELLTASAACSRPRRCWRWSCSNRSAHRPARSSASGSTPATSPRGC